ncbi:SorB family sulfite dehydrogenase c-type cytochrome subunit [Methylocystis sp. JAN1]|uniref:SorB family sulfite dehydrogenase c-type cytochrome subunit n=1 Tax=Methylocystis sp. JAN1 TaxID=3397211 RepID=UPI003FA1A95A
MRICLRFAPSMACVLVFSNMALAEPRSYALPREEASFRPGPGMEAAQNNCLSCHSADYVSTQPPRLGPRFWEAVVLKMVNAYHAPIVESDVKPIVEYLSRAY